MTVKLDRQLKASKGKGSTKGKASSTHGAAEHISRSWNEMSADERWWLQELWKGNLKRQLLEAKT